VYLRQDDPPIRMEGAELKGPEGEVGSRPG
jgi:hypothetical protein